MNERKIECDGEKWDVSLAGGGRSPSSAQGFHGGPSTGRLLQFVGPGSCYSVPVSKDAKLADLSDGWLSATLKRLRGDIH